MLLPNDLKHKLMLPTDDLDVIHGLLRELVYEVYRQQAGYIPPRMDEPLPTRTEIKAYLKEDMMSQPYPEYKSPAWLELNYALEITKNWEENDELE